MSTVQTYLYNQNQEVIIDTGTTDRTYTMLFAKDLKVYSGTNNTIRFLMKNRDQKPVNLTGSSVVFYIVDNEGSEILRRTCTIENSIGGVAKIVLADYDLIQIEPGSYTYSLIYTDTESNESPVYNDEYWRVGGTIDVVGKKYPSFVDSIETSVGNYTDNEGVLSGSSDTVYVYDKIVHTNGLITVAYYLDEFVGNIEITASLDNDNFFIVDSDTYDEAQTGIIYKNFNGMFMNLKFNITKTAGDLSKILIRP